MRKPIVPIASRVSVALESSDRGFLGQIVEYPGAFVRGESEARALEKVQGEVKGYLAWLGANQSPGHLLVEVVQRHKCSLMVEDADSEILLDADASEMNASEFELRVELCRYSGTTFLSLYDTVKFKDWVDDSKKRKTFYGDAPSSIRATFDHVRRTQYYYLSRTGISFAERAQDFLDIRGYCLDRISELYARDRNSLVFQADNESWTLKKILRRFVLHDRVHGKAIVRMLEKQRRLGMIHDYADPFHFDELNHSPPAGS